MLFLDDYVENLMCSVLTQTSFQLFKHSLEILWMATDLERKFPFSNQNIALKTLQKVKSK